MLSDSWFYFVLIACIWKDFVIDFFWVRFTVAIACSHNFRLFYFANIENEVKIVKIKYNFICGFNLFRALDFWLYFQFCWAKFKLRYFWVILKGSMVIKIINTYLIWLYSINLITQIHHQYLVLFSTHFASDPILFHSYFIAFLTRWFALSTFWH
jgi:hypothetical protein